MKLSEVTKEDCVRVAQLINMLQIAEYPKILGKDMCAGADSIRWLHTFATDLAKIYSEQQTTSESTPAPVEPAPSEGFTVKSYNPGKPSKPGKK